MAESALHPLCTRETFVRNTSYSNVHRALIRLGDVEQTVDIEHIRLPLYPELTGITFDSDEERDAYDNCIAHCLRKAIEIINRMQAGEPPHMPEKASNITLGMVTHLHQDACARDNGGSDVYLVSEPMERFWDSAPCETVDGVRGIRLVKLIETFGRLIMTMFNLNQCGINIGIVDMDALCVAKIDAKGTGTKQDFVTFTNFLYARARDDDGSMWYPAKMPYNTHRRLLKGEHPDEITDVFSWGAALMSILNGSYGTDDPNFRRPQNSSYPPELVDLASAAISGKKSYREIRNELLTLRKAILTKVKDGDADANVFIPVNVPAKDFKDEPVFEPTEEEAPVAPEEAKNESEADIEEAPAEAVASAQAPQEAPEEVNATKDNASNTPASASELLNEAATNGVFNGKGLVLGMCSQISMTMSSLRNAIRKDEVPERRDSLLISIASINEMLDKVTDYVQHVPETPPKEVGSVVDDFSEQTKEKASTSKNDVENEAAAEEKESGEDGEMEFSVISFDLD